MLSVTSLDFLNTKIDDFMIPSEKVAHVQIGNNAEHALLVLTKTGYSAVPVLNLKYQIQGLLSMQMITDAILGLDHIEYERLETIKVDDIMQPDIPAIEIGQTFRRAFELLINHNFLCVVDEEQTFIGILTRRVLLKQLKKYVYQQTYA